jgi:exopolysaccharide biosynthesis polyprenyl glycosylphosphotransferase
LLKRYGQFFIFLLGIADLLVIAAAWIAAYAVSFGAVHLRHSAMAATSRHELLPCMVVALLLTPLVYSRLGLYAPKRTVSIWREMASVQHGVLLSWGMTYVIVALVRQTPVSRSMMIVTLLFWMLLATLMRLLGRVALRYLRSRGLNIRRAAIVGAGRLGKRLHATLTRNTWTGIDVRYFIDDLPGDADRKTRNLQVLGPAVRMEQILQNDPVDIVFVAMSRVTQERIQAVINRLSALPVHLCVVPDLLAVQFLCHEAGRLEDLSIISLTQSPQDGWSSLSKSIFDRLMALLALGLLSIPMLVIALLVKLSSRGPVFYRQERAGLGGKAFEMFKFRTMREDAEAATGPVWAVPDDPRVTPVGRWLRRTSLDELPQLFNVLRGDMSLVGPRPERPELIGRFTARIPRYVLRHHVKSGMTGWAQIHGMRGCTSLHKRLQYDLFYVKNWSFALDLWILLLTPFRVFVSPNAY